jgi:hypothetical protein
MNWNKVKQQDQMRKTPEKKLPIHTGSNWTGANLTDAAAPITYTQKLELEKLGVITDSTWTEQDARKVLRVAKKASAKEGLIKVIKANGEVTWEKPKPAKYKKKPESNEITIHVEHKPRVKQLTAFDEKLIHKMKVLEAIKAKQGYLNGAMSQELKRLKNLYKNVK